MSPILLAKVNLKISTGKYYGDITILLCLAFAPQVIE